MKNGDPSDLSLALLSGICDESSKDDARALIKETSDYIKNTIAGTVEKFGGRSLYVMQSMGDILHATVRDTLVRMSNKGTKH